MKKRGLARDLRQTSFLKNTLGRLLLSHQVCISLYITCTTKLRGKVMKMQVEIKDYISKNISIIYINFFKKTKNVEHVNAWWI